MPAFPQLSRFRETRGVAGGFRHLVPYGLAYLWLWFSLLLQRRADFGRLGKRCEDASAGGVKGYSLKSPLINSYW